MRLVVLGSYSAAVPGPGGRASGYLVEHEGTRILLDCGNGVLGELAHHARIPDVAAVVLSHLHHDHVADLYPLALFHKHTKGKVRLLAPPGTRTLLYRWFTLFSSDPDAYVASFDIVEYAPWAPYDVGALRVTPTPVEHNVPCFAARVEGGGRTLVYGGDTKESALLEEAAQRADLLLAEATYTDDAPPERLEHHMSARQAGALARRAGAKRLVLTHFLVRTDRERARREAAEAFGAPVELAEEGRGFDV